MKNTAYISFLGFVFVFALLLFIQGVYASDESEVGFDYTIEEGELFVDIVNGLTGATALNPSVNFGEGAFSSDPIVAEGTLGSELESVRVFNYTSAPSWTLNLAADNVESLWSNPNDSYAYNHVTDPNQGRLTVNPAIGTILSDVGCNITELSPGSAATFQYDVVDSIDLLFASVDAPTFCRFDLRNVTMDQIVPGAQPVGTYTLGMVLTVSSDYESPQTYEEYIQQGQNTDPIVCEPQPDEFSPCTSSAQWEFVTEAPTGHDWTQTSTAPEIWKDNTTGLYWTESFGGFMDWTDSIAYCNTLNHGGRTDWKLPTRDELMQVAPASIYINVPDGNYCNGCYSGNDMFAGTGSAFTGDQYYWSLNTVSDISGEVWVVRLDNGNVDYISDFWNFTDYPARRCVARD